MTREQKRSLLLIAAAAVLLIGLHFVPVTGWLKLVLYLIPYLLVGGETLVDACKGIYNRQPFDENLLMAVATIGAMVLGDYPEAVSVMLFYQIGELFESYAVGRSRRNIGDLMDIRPDYANVETADGVARVKPEQVAVGDTIVVKPGERVPLDGTVLTGTSALNMSALTGESAPVDVAEGSTVVSGSVNLSGVLRLRVEKVYAESTVARILELVENSSLKKAHTERFITKFARVYTPSVCGAALALAVHPRCLLRRSGTGIPATHRSAVDGPARPLWRLDLPRADVPRHQLPVRARDLDPAVVLRRHRRRVRPRYPHQGFELSGDAGQDRPCRL